MNDEQRRQAGRRARRTRSTPARVSLMMLGACLGLWPFGLGAQPAPLRLVVIAGEDTVNVISQRTAVTPIVEVRDRNDQPVAGVLVQFAIARGRATFNGGRTVAVVTGANGRATATGFTPTGNGPLQITASASSAGQTVSVTIAQTSVATAAEAAGTTTTAAAGSGGGSTAAGTGSAATAGAATAGGGISLTTWLVAAAAVGGGAYAAAEVLNGSSTETEYSGRFSGVLTQSTANRSCTRDETRDGSITLTVADPSAATISGEAAIQGSYTSVGFTGPQCAPPGNPNGAYSQSVPLTGTASNITFNVSRAGNPGTTVAFAFTGTLSGNQVRGTYTETWITVLGFGGSQSFPVILTKR